MRCFTKMTDFFNSCDKAASRKIRCTTLGNFEGLESRVLMTAQVEMVGAELQIDGTDNNDVIEVSYANQAQTLVQAVVSDANGNVLAEGVFAANQIGFVDVEALGGDDFVRNNTRINSRQRGQGGEDVLIGGTGHDFLSGGFGNDADFSGNVSSIDRDDGFVVVTGTGANDRISVQYKDNNEIRITIKDANGKILDQEDYDTNSVQKIIVHGLEGNDRIVNSTNITMEARGGNGIDFLSGGSARDDLQGEFGSDVLNGNSGNDLLHGGDNDDQILGGPGHDTLIGANGNDYLNGAGGNDQIDGGSGDDVILGGSGGDTIDAGAGDDTVFGEYLSSGNYYTGDDVIKGGSGDDDLYGGRGVDRIDGDGGNDYIVGGRDNDVINGGSGHDILYGDRTDRNSVYAGNDVIHGNDGMDQLFGGRGDDRLFGDSGLYDTLFGDGGNDYLNGGAGTDYMYGGDDDDTLIGGSGRDFLYGMNGDDYLNGSSDGQRDFLSGGAGRDTFVDYYSYRIINHRLVRQYEEFLNDVVDGEDARYAYWAWRS